MSPGDGALPRITIVTNGNAFARIGLLPLLAEHGHRWQLQVIVTTGLRRQRGNRALEALRLFRRWGFRYSAYKIATYALPLAAEVLRRSPQRVFTECRSRGVPVEHARNVNRDAAFDRIRQFGPDLLVSFSCPYRIQSRLLELARVGCLNVHSSMLPAYAGVCTYVHVLADGCTSTGVTVHEMVEEFDAGRIVAQQELAVPHRTSVYALFRRQCEVASKLLQESADRVLREGRIDGWAQDAEKRTYCGEPNRGDIVRLHEAGHCLMDLDDVATSLGSRARSRDAQPQLQP